MLVTVMTDLGRETPAPFRHLHTVAVRCDGCGRETEARNTDGSEFSVCLESLQAMDDAGFIERLEGRYQRHRCQKCR